MKTAEFETFEMLKTTIRTSLFQESIRTYTSNATREQLQPNDILKAQSAKTSGRKISLPDVRVVQLIAFLEN